MEEGRDGERKRGREGELLLVPREVFVGFRKCPLLTNRDRFPCATCLGRRAEEGTRGGARSRSRRRTSGATLRLASGHRGPHPCPGTRVLRAEVPLSHTCRIFYPIRRFVALPLAVFHSHPEVIIPNVPKKKKKNPVESFAWKNV